MKFYYHVKKLVLNKPTQISEDASFILHEWTEEDKFNELTTTRINESIIAADKRNHGKQSGEQGKDTYCVSNETCNNISQNLTEEELELIKDFLMIE